MKRIFNALHYLFSGVGLLLLVAALLMVQRTRSFIAESQRAEGTVLRLERSSSGDTWRPVIGYQSESGLDVEFTAPIGSDPPAYAEGEQVDVLYRRGEEYEARLDGFFYLWFFPALIGGFAVIFLTIGGTFFFLGWRVT